MQKFIIVAAESQGPANIYAYTKWDAEGGWNTFSTPLWDKSGGIAAFCCGINLPDGAEVAPYMHVYTSLEDGLTELGLRTSQELPADDPLTEPPEWEY